MKQLRPARRKRHPDSARSLDTRLVKMAHNLRSVIRSKVARRLFRNAKSKPERNSHVLLARLAEFQTGQLIALSVLVDSFGEVFLNLHPAIQVLLLLWAYRFLR